jgi:predicted dehydrogenase
MKITVVGTGSIGKRHLSTLINLQKKQNIKEIACFEINIERAESVKKEFNEISVYSSLGDSVKGSDLIFICVPTSLHYNVWREIKILGDFNYFFEKPLSHTFKNCDEMIFHQKRINKHAIIGYMLRLHPVLNRAKTLIEENIIGNILNVRAESGFYLPFWHPWEDYRDFYMSWKTGGGGVLLDTSHEIDYLMWMFGDIKYVQGYSLTTSDLEITTDDYTSCLFEFDNGIMGELHLDLLQPEESRYVKVIGSKGVLIADITKNYVKYNTVENIEWINENIAVDFDKIYEEEDNNAINLIKRKPSITTSIVDGAKVMQVIEATRRSSSSGNRIRLPIYE